MHECEREPATSQDDLEDVTRFHQAPNRRPYRQRFHFDNPVCPVEHNDQTLLSRRVPDERPGNDGDIGGIPYRPACRQLPRRPPPEFESRGERRRLDATHCAHAGERFERSLRNTAQAARAGEQFLCNVNRVASGGSATNDERNQLGIRERRCSHAGKPLPRPIVDRDLRHTDRHAPTVAITCDIHTRRIPPAALKPVAAADYHDGG